MNLPPMFRLRRMKVILGALVGLLIICGVARVAAQGEVIVYTALDREFSEPILKLFEQRTQIRVRPVYDTEAVKTVGLVNRLLAERERPRADVFWNNEILRSIQLKHEGLTQPYKSPSAATIPSKFKDYEGYWTGFAARARVILVNRKVLPDEAQWPTRVQDLADPKWNKRAGFGKPLFGTTSTHAAVMWSMGGEAKATAFWNAALGNAVMLSGNAQARDAVASGELAWCLTDTDDAHGAIEDGAPVAIIYPSDDPAGPGALLIPNTVNLLKNCPNEANGKALIDFLLSEEVEAALAASRSAQIPVRAGIPGPSGIPPLDEKATLQVDWEQAYGAIAPSSAWLSRKVADSP